MRLPKELKHGLVFRLVRGLINLINLLPRSVALFCGSVLGLLAWRVLASERYRVSRHLTLVYGDSLTAAEKNNVGRSFFVNSGKNLIDVIRLRKHYDSEIRPRVTIEGLEHWDKAYKGGKGVIGITGHIGNFELLAVHLAALGYRVAVIGRELYDTRMDQMLVANREALGLTNIATTDSPRKLLQWLKDGGAVGVLIDTDSSRVRGIFIPVFGRLAQTPIGQSMLALKTGAALVPAVCLRNDDNTYRIVVRPEIEIDRTDDFDRDVYNLTLKCSRVLEEIINENKSQWIWIHNRWCARPPETA